ncbi:ABC transporter substrate-binding protein [Thermus tengchongensis]|uniref:ABC transporter substrate-binding protein n=1 Tax=Thermus tengchongensis TaxID=1214928 RepID=UPI001F3C5C6C|nr:ABC transporter substrate-binding protein [Thermus tengchongensis]
MGIVTFLSGPASVFGIPARNAADLLIDQWNRQGGIAGVRIRPIVIDEAGGAERQVAEFRRLALDERVDLVIGYISSADCLAVAPVAEELRMPTILFDCGTPQVFEERRYTYVFRTAAHAALDNVAAALYILKTNPNVRTIAGINQDYAWGRDAWELFKGAMQALKPDVRVVGEFWPRLYAGEYSTEISRLLSLRPDIIHSSFWGGDLISFVRQGLGRGLFGRSRVVLVAGEHMLQELGRTLPNGVIVGARGDHWFLHPTSRDDPEHRAFVEEYRRRFNRYPVYPSYHMAQALLAMRAGYERALRATGGRWPTKEEFVQALVGLEIKTFTGKIRIREDHQAIEDALFGQTVQTPQYPFAILERMILFPASMVNPPVGVRSVDWVRTLRPELLRQVPDPR